MSTPQQPELHRSKRSPATPDSVKARTGGPGGDTGGPGPVPEANVPGHRPDVDQDKPLVPPPAYRVGTEDEVPEHAFGFAFAGVHARLAGLVGVAPDNAEVRVTPSHLVVRWGPWRLETDRENIAAVEMTRPLRWVETSGLPRPSLRGVSFAAAPGPAVRVHLRRAEAVLLPVPVLRHREVTLGVADADGLIAALAHAGR